MAPNEPAPRVKLAATREALWAEVARARSNVPGVMFPRSRAMQLLLGGHSKKALWAAGLGMLALKPRLAGTVLRMAPGLLRALLR